MVKTNSKKILMIIILTALIVLGVAVSSFAADPIIIGGGSLTDIVRYRYFLKGSGIMDKNHNPSNKFTTDGQDFELPTLSVKNYN